MERKRKLPARAAARVEQMAKRRTLTPPERHSETPPPPPPAAEPEAQPAPTEEPAEPLPTSIQASKPLPTVEEPQPEDLPAKDYQSVSESGVLSESLVRSRRKWISEGIFEKYWTKPTKKKGVVIEEPNNPPKDSMIKIGQVTITVEPHVFEVTMYGVKDPKPPPPQPIANNPARPIMQYGPPNGVMPPPAPAPPPPARLSAGPSSAAASPGAGPAFGMSEAVKPPPTQPSTPQQLPAQPPQQTALPLPNGQPPLHTPSVSASTQQGFVGVAPPALASPAQLPASAPASTAAPAPTPAPLPQSAMPMSSPRGMETILSPSTAPPHMSARPVVQAPSMGTPPPPHFPATVPAPLPSYPPSGLAKPSGMPAHMPQPSASHGVNGTSPAVTPGKPAPGTDPIILTLAEKAGEDPELRELMKRVAQGQAAKPELERFQAIIDAITAESKRRGTPGPSADRLLVDGKSVRYFADEVRTILDIVLASNPKQESATLRPPEGSNPLVVKLVKKALDDIKTRDLVTRIAQNRPKFSDPLDLQAVLDILKRELVKENERVKKESPAPSNVSTPTTKLNGLPNGNGTALPNNGAPAPQSLRSKGPPPLPAKPDLSAVVFEFAGGSGDRYLFPKFSILEYVPVPQGQQVIASFLIVRRGSAAEYPMADPTLDYYQPVTIRLYTPTGRLLDHLMRVTAPEEEVRRYMNDIMDKTTRAEYILLAMRLPRPEAAKEQGEATPAEDSDVLEKDKGNKWNKQSGLRWINQSATPTPAGATPAAPVAPPTALWTTKPPKPEIRELPPRSQMYSKDAFDAMDTDDQYQKFIAGVSRKEPEEV